MSKPEQFPYVNPNANMGEAGFRPYLPMALGYQQSSVAVSALLDTGASINVLPYSIGLELGYVWERQTAAINLTGNLANYESRIVVVQASVGKFESIELVFAWTESTQVPLILGQVNFFMEFDVCFYRSQLYFAVSPKNQRLGIQ
jgi:Aspartyl protease